MDQMKRLGIVVFTTAALMMATATVGLADAGAPGTTFPEQPGAHVANACATVLSNPGTGEGGAALVHLSPTAAAITQGLIADGCFGG